jgi:short-subunit dehydrogenase
MSKICIITGAAAGIGYALAKACVARGDVVVMTDINESHVKERAGSLIGLGSGAARGVQLDVTCASEVEGIVKQVVAEHGKVDYFFNNAGVAVSGEVRDLNLEHWKKVIDVNLAGVINGCHAVYPEMVNQRSGHIINIASLAGLIPFVTNAPYSASKHAVVGLSNTLRLEGEALGVRVSVVCPGFVKTNIYEASDAINVDKDKLNDSIPFAAIGADVAALKILNGVKKNRGVIIFPFYAKLLWWVNRLSSRLAAPLARKMIADFRKLRGS